jgi:hypothetical protein
MLMTMFFLGFGCNTSKPAPDPLAGWHFYSRTKVSRSITDDYQDYIQKLPPEVRYYAKGSLISFFVDGVGQHAVKIEIPLNGTYSEHVLIYDNNDKRIKVVVFSGGRYSS